MDGFLGHRVWVVFWSVEFEWFSRVLAPAIFLRVTRNNRKESPYGDSLQKRNKKMNEKSSELPYLSDLNRKATLRELKRDLEILEKYSVHKTFAHAIEMVTFAIRELEKKQ